MIGWSVTSLLLFCFVFVFLFFFLPVKSDVRRVYSFVIHFFSLVPFLFCFISDAIFVDQRDVRDVPTVPVV